MIEDWRINQFVSKVSFARLAHCITYPAIIWTEEFLLKEVKKVFVFASAKMLLINLFSRGKVCSQDLFECAAWKGFLIVMTHKLSNIRGIVEVITINFVICVRSISVNEISLRIMKLFWLVHYKQMNDMKNHSTCNKLSSIACSNVCFWFCVCVGLCFTCAENIIMMGGTFWLCFLVFLNVCGWKTVFSYSLHSI